MKAGKSIKLLALVIIAAAIGAMLCSCLISIDEPDNTAVPDATSATVTDAPSDATAEPTAEPTADAGLALANVEAFYEVVKGSWTADDGSFVHFDENEDKVSALFAVWNAGGEFPAGTLTNAEKLAEGVYKLTISMNDGTTAEFVCTVSDKEMILSSGDQTESYKYYPDKQLNTEAPAEADPLAFVNSLAGTWTAQDNRYITFHVDNNEPRMLFGGWNAEAGMIDSKITALTDNGNGSYTVTFAPDYEDYALTYGFTVNEGSITVDAGNGTVLTYAYLSALQEPMLNYLLSSSEAAKVFEGPFTENGGGNGVLYIEQLMGMAQLMTGTADADPETYKSCTVLGIVQDRVNENCYRANVQTETESGIQILEYAFEFKQDGTLLDVTVNGKTTTYNVPADGEAEAEARALAFAETYAGTWTAVDMSFINISMDNGTPAGMLGIWYAGGPFPAAVILDAQKITETGNKTVYLLTPKDSSTKEVFEADCTVTADSGMNGLDTLTTAVDGNGNTVYTKYRTYQLGSMTEATAEEIYSMLGEKGEGRYWETNDGNYLRISIDSGSGLVVRLGRSDGVTKEKSYDIFFTAVAQNGAHANYTLVVSGNGEQHIIDFVLYNLDTVAAVAIDDPITGSATYYEFNP